MILRNFLVKFMSLVTGIFPLNAGGCENPTPKNPSLRLAVDSRNSLSFSLVHYSLSLALRLRFKFHADGDSQVESLDLRNRFRSWGRDRIEWDLRGDEGR